MKHYLLTWYGITDLRAALGFEEFGGPVLGALRTGAYTDVMVLAYTDPSKSSPGSVTDQKTWLDRVAAARTQGVTVTRQQENGAVDAFSNTLGAHELYKKWLKDETSKLNLGVIVDIRLCVKELAALNDAKGIYDAAVEALDIVSSSAEDKDVTFYLSPGTPVMAFTWAFVSLVNPELNIKIIASSDYRKPPEAISLPYELLVPSSRTPRHAIPGAQTEFDAIFHLFGEQRLPSLFGILQFPSKRHVFVSSEKYPSSIMRGFIPRDAEYDELLVNPFDPMSTKVQILKAVAQMPAGSRVGFNLTGGTKLMFAGAIAACRKIGGKPFYFETRDHKLVFLHDFSVMEMRGIENLEWFFESSGFSVSAKGKWNDVPGRAQRIQLTKLLWKERKTIATIYRELANIMDSNGGSPCQFDIQRRDVAARFEQSGRASLRIANTNVVLGNCPDFAKYLCGGWLEEYVYLLVEPMMKSGAIRDVRIGLQVAWKSSGTAVTGPLAQEFDVCFTDGKRLFIIECKAGAVLSEDIYKLQNCVRNYGGVEAKGILISAFPPHHDATRRRLAAAANLISASGTDVPRLLTRIIRSG